MTGGFVLAFVVCLTLAFLLAAAEAALQRVTRGGADELLEEGRRGAKALHLVTGDSAGYLSVTTFVRITLEMTAAVVATIVAYEYFDDLWEVVLSAIAVLAVASVAIVGVSPRTLGRQHAVGISLAAAPAVVWLRRLLGPLARLLVTLGNAVTPGKGFRDGPFESEAELRELLDFAGDNQVIEEEEREMLHSVFELGDTIVREVMVPRPDMITIDRSKKLRQAMSLFLRGGFSRVPVLGEDADDPVGLLYFKDVAGRLHDDPDSKGVRVEEIMRPVWFTPDSKPVDALMREMQRDQFHMAVVVDEYGGTAGLVTIEDLLEEIVGEISDEHDREGPGVEELPDGTTRVPASMHVDDFAELFDVDLDDEDDVDTVGGLLTKALGRVPILGSRAQVEGLELTAEKMAGRRHRIASILVRRLDPPADPDEGGSS